MAGELIAGIEGGEEPLGPLLGLGLRFLRITTQFLEEHDEFIPTQPGHGAVGSGLILEASRHFLQEQVADAVAQGLVEAAEVVQVDEQQCPPVQMADAGG